MLIVLAASLAYAGVSGLCLSMPRHHAQVWRRHPTRAMRATLRIAGWLCVIGALVVSAAVWGWPIGSVAWVGSLSVSALALVFLLSYAPRLAAVLALLSLLFPLLLLLEMGTAPIFHIAENGGCPHC